MMRVLMIMFLSKESTTNLLLANICFSNLLIAFLVKVVHHVLLSFFGQFYLRWVLLLLLVFNANLVITNLFQPISAIYVSYALSTGEWQVRYWWWCCLHLTGGGVPRAVWNISKKSSIFVKKSLNSIPPGGFGFLLPLYSHISHLLTCLPILHRRYNKYNIYVYERHLHHHHHQDYVGFPWEDSPAVLLFHLLKRDPMPLSKRSIISWVIHLYRFKIIAMLPST